jgi:putative transposase
VVVRPPRIEQAGGVFRVVARGNERASVFRDDLDRQRFLEVLGGVADRYRRRVLAYCLWGIISICS